MIIVQQNKPTKEMLENFLQSVDSSFSVPLSKKQNLNAYANKLFDTATICAEMEDGKILSMVAGYTENLTEGIAYIAVVATQKEATGRGLASKCVKDFINICREKNIPAVHLYTAADNTVAINMYSKIGFVDYILPNESRPLDRHLIYKIAKES